MRWMCVVAVLAAPCALAQADGGEPDGGLAPPEPTVRELLQRIQALEKAAADREAPSAQPPSTAAAFIQNVFNPDISVIADLTFFGSNVPDGDAPVLETPGFLSESDWGGKHSGVNFNYFEMAFNASVDPFFDFAGVLTFDGVGIDIEEAYVDTRSLPWGFRARVGKFLSSFGRINGQHQHYWDFFDTPLIYEGLIGSEGLKDVGVRLSWTAPVDFLLTANAEVLEGLNDEAHTFNAVGYELTASDGTVLSRKDPFKPALYVGSLKASFDVGNHVFLLGGSVMYGHSTQKQINGLDTDLAFYAPGTVIYNAELTYKYLISSYRSITWQSEYLGRVSSGELALASDAQLHHADKLQGGFYSQLIWRFDEPGQWRVGARVDVLAQNSLVIDGAPQPLDAWLARYSAMLEFSPSEFSRFRLQYEFDRSRYFAGVQRDVHEVLLEVNLSIGPHGAHSF